MRAGSRLGGRPRQHLELPRDPDLVHIVTESSAHLPGALREFAEREVGVLAINGGDGTLHRTLTEMMRRKPFAEQPHVAPLRGGRTNMTALDFGATRSPQRGVQNLVDACRRGAWSTRRVDRSMLRVTPGTGAAPLYGFFVGTGVVRRSIEFIHRVFPAGRARGVFGGAVTTASVVTQAALGKRSDVLFPDKHGLVLDGEIIEPSEYLLVMATSLDRLFLRMRPFWGVRPRPVRLTAIGWDAEGIGRNALRVASGHGSSLSSSRGYLSRNIRQAVIRQDCGFTVDGELFDTDHEDSIEVGATRDIPFLRA